MDCYLYSAATVAGWNQNRIAAWYPCYNITIVLDGQSLPPWAAATIELFWNLNITQIGENITFQYWAGTTLVCTTQATIQSGSNNFFFDANDLQISSE